MASEKLKRRLGFWDSVAINVGIVIGVGIFRTPGEIAKYVSTGPFILLAWVLGAIISLTGVFCYAELSSRFPETGGTYIFLRESYGRLVGFLFGWIEFSILRAGAIAAVSYVFTDYLGHLIPFAGGHQKVTAILIIGIFTCVNAAGIHLGTHVQNVLSSVKILSMLLMAGFIFVLTKNTALKITFQPAGGIPWTYGAMVAPAMIPVLWTYGGWHQSTFMSGEFRDTQKALPFSLITGILVVAGVYVLMNSAYLSVMTPAQMLQSKAIAADIFSRLLGPYGGSLVSVAVLISAGGALNSTILTGGRIPFAVAQDYPRLGWMARVDPRFGTPLRSLLLNSLWASILVLWGNFEQLLFFCAFATWLFFALIGWSVFIFRRRSALVPVFEMPGFPAVPILFILFSAWLCWTSVHHAPRETLMGLFLLLTGIPVYFLCGKPETAKSSIEESPLAVP